MLPRTLIALTALLFACSGGDDAKDDTSSEADADTDTDTDADSDTDTDTDTDTDADTDSDTDADTDSDTDADTDTDTDTAPAADLSGTVEFDLVSGSTTLCDATIEVTGTAAAGTCTGCDYSFAITSEVTRDDGASDCFTDPLLQYSQAFYSLTTAGDAKATELGFAEDMTAMYLGGVEVQDALRIWGLFYMGPYVFSTGRYLTYGTDSTPSQAWIDNDTLYWDVSASGNYYITTYAYIDSSSACSGYGYSSSTAASGGTALDADDISCAGDQIDAWTFVGDGSTVYVSADTLSEDTAVWSDLYLIGGDSCVDLVASYNFPCAYGTDMWCPSLEWATTAGEAYTLLVSTYGCGGAIGEYQLSATGGTGWSLLADDVPRISNTEVVPYELRSVGQLAIAP